MPHHCAYRQISSTSSISRLSGTTSVSCCLTTHISFPDSSHILCTQITSFPRAKILPVWFRNNCISDLFSLHQTQVPIRDFWGGVCHCVFLFCSFFGYIKTDFFLSFKTTRMCIYNVELHFLFRVSDITNQTKQLFKHAEALP